MLQRLAVGRALSAAQRVAAPSSTSRGKRLVPVAALLQPRRSTHSDKSFDSYKVVEALKEAGFTKQQSELLLRIVQNGMTVSRVTATELLATKEDLIALKGELSEKVFNSTMKFDISQRHTREIMERDLTSLKADLRSSQRQEVSLLQGEIASLEKRTLERREHDEHKFSMLQNEIAQVEKRTLQYAAGFMASLVGLLLTAARVFNFTVESPKNDPPNPRNNDHNNYYNHNNSHNHNHNHNNNDNQYNAYQPPPPPAPSTQNSNMYSEKQYLPRTHESLRTDNERFAMPSHPSQPKPETVACPATVEEPRVCMTVQELVDLATLEFDHRELAALQQVGGVERFVLDFDSLTRWVEDAPTSTAQQPLRLHAQQRADSITAQVRV